MTNRSMVATYTLAESTYSLSASGETLVITSNLVQIKPTTGTHTVSIREAISGITYVVNVNEVSPLLDSSQGIYCTKDIAETSVSLDITSYALNGYIDIGTDNLTSKIILHNTPSFSGGSAGVTSFNTRVGVVTLQESDVTSVWPKASAGSLGVVRVGTNLSIDGDGILSASGGGGGAVESVNSRTGAVIIQASDITAVWPKAAAGSLGVIRVGSGLAIDGDGILSNTIPENTWAAKDPAATFGKGLSWFSDIVAMGYSDGTNWRTMLVSDLNGDFVANIVPRTDTLANLLTVVGSEGELASATDTNAIVQFNGTSAPGKVYYPYNPNFDKNFGNSLGTLVPINHFSGSTASLIETYKMTPKSNCIIGMLSGTKTSIYLSYDAINWFKAVASSAGASNYAATIGNKLIAVAVAATDTAYFAVAPFASYTTYSTVLANSALTWHPPIIIGDSAALVVTSATGTESAILGEAVSEVYKPALPSSQTWLAPVAPGFGSTNVFALALASGTTTAAILSGPKTTATWAAITLPITISSNARVVFTWTRVVIYNYSVDNIVIAASYDREAGTIGSWTTVTIPDINKISANNTMFFCTKNPAAGYILTSTDGITWEQVNLPSSTTTEVIANFNGGIIRTAALKSYLISNNKNIDIIDANFIPIKFPYYDAIGFINGTSTKLYSFTGIPDRVKSIHTSSATGTINITENAKASIISTVTQTALTVNLPPNPGHGHEISVRFENTHTTLTIGTQSAPELTLFNGVAAQYTITPSVSTGQTFRFVFSQVANSWYQV